MIVKHEKKIPIIKMIKKHINLFYTSTFILLLLSLTGNAQIVSKEPEDLFTVGSEAINFHSEINNSDYKLYVNLPASYHHDLAKRYPVFYTLDGYRTFGVAVQVFDGIWDDGFAPEMIIVGINNGGTNERPTLTRSRDLTPTAIERIASSGGASTFLKVLSDEIIPMIDSQYKTDKASRTLAGTSFAGMFTFYTLFTKPNLFNNYIINNATFWWDDNYLQKLEETFHQKNKNLNAKVVFMNSEFNDMPNAIRVYEQIKKHQYKNLTLGFRKIDNMGHLGGEAEAINQGMRFAYKRPVIKLTEEELKPYCGTYKDGNYVRQIMIEDGELNLTREGASQGIPIQAITSSEFAILGKYFKLHFNRDEKGKVISFTNQLDTDQTRVRTAFKIK
ncbi:hypothetical protein MTsPCn5_37520 [Croceitalea sp. MTPC5]|uniref:alpha/beta hydrolase n=1 Tax=Croceitalea sp. MTPC5 TaxID=3056565 RepID=UPI002B3CBA16|nr:hypothetical protein MTsPCn5_37520 [Croceitalea sp. MTPC5]